MQSEQAAEAAVEVTRERGPLAQAQQVAMAIGRKSIQNEVRREERASGSECYYVSDVEEGVFRTGGQ